MRWSWKLTAQHYRFYPHENITHLTIGPGIDDFSTLKKLLEPSLKLSLTVMPFFPCHNDVKIFLVCTRFHNEKSLPVRQITWIMLTKTEIMRTISHFFGQNYFHNHDQISNFVLIMKIILTKIFSYFLNCLLHPTFEQIFDSD